MTWTRKAHAWALIAAPLAAGCVPDPVEWDAPAYQPPRGASAAAEPVPGNPRLCVFGETALGEQRFQGGWTSDGELLVMRSPDEGASWEPPVVADSRERPANLCNRPAPALFADSSNGFLHLAYYAEPRGGAGVYYVHSMYAAQLAQVGAGMFEQPLALTYGTRAVRTAVASRDDTVVVAYEDPNSPRGPLALALSTTAGHSFDRRVGVSPGAAAAPAVSLRSGEVVVEWREVTDPQRHVRRRGSFR